MENSKAVCKNGHSRTPDNLLNDGTSCRECQRQRSRKWKSKNRASLVESHAKHYKENRQAVLAKVRQRTYNITPEAYEEMLKSQKGKCRICDVVFSELVVPYVDHDHSCCKGNLSCGRCIRGLLCRNCNFALGLFGDSCKNLSKALKYLGDKSWPIPA